MDLFVSHRTLKNYRTLPRALGEWCCDSGGFTELSTYGEWRTSSAEYVEAVQRYDAEVGGLVWCAPQDWMCEPHILEMTGKTVYEHQQRTIDSYLELAGPIPVVPVLQGWTPDDYLSHVEQYLSAGVDLYAAEIVGLGSVCRRNRTEGVAELLVDLAGINLHGFGFKRNGLSKYAHLFESADSMAWSFTARRAEPLPGCSHRSCTNCLRYALRWRDAVISSCGLFGMESL